MVWRVISYHRRSNLLRIEGNLNSNRYVRKVLQPEVPFLQGIPGAMFQLDNACARVAKTVRDFCSAQPELNLHGSSRELSSCTSFLSVNFYIFEETHGSSSMLRSGDP